MAEHQLFIVKELADPEKNKIFSKSQATTPRVPCI